jgi:hypothetical protein
MSTDNGAVRALAFRSPSRDSCRCGEDEPGGGGVALPAGEGERAALLRAHGGDGRAHRAVRGDGDRRLRARARPFLQPRQADGGARGVLLMVQGSLRVPPVRRPGGRGRHAEEAGAHGRVHPRQARRGVAARAPAAVARAGGKPRAGSRRRAVDQGPSGARGAADRGARGGHGASRARGTAHRGRPGRRGGRLPEPEGGRHARRGARAAAGAGAVRRQPGRRGAERRRVRPLGGGLGDRAGPVGERAGEPARRARGRPQHAGAGRDVQPRHGQRGGGQRADVLRQREQRGVAATRGADAGVAGASWSHRRRPFRGVGAVAAADVRSDVRHAYEAAASDAGADCVAAIRQEWHARAGALGNARAAAATAAAAADPA